MRAIPIILSSRATARSSLQVRTTERFGTSSLTRLRRTSTRLFASARPLPAKQDEHKVPAVNTRNAKKTVTFPYEAESTAEKYGANENKATKGYPLSATMADPFDQMNPFETISPTTLLYTGDAVIPITSKLNIVRPQDDTPRGIWPVFRLMVKCQPRCGVL